MKRILLIGAGRGGMSLLHLFKDNEDVEITAVVDKSHHAPGILLAKEMNITTSSDYLGSLKDEDYDLVINVTGNSEVKKTINNYISPSAELLEGFSAKLLWDLVEKQKEARKKEKKMALELKATNEELQDLSSKLEEKVSIRTAELRQVNMDLKKSNQYKSDFIANMSHELRTPLNSINGFSELLLTEPIGELNTPQKKYLNNIHSSGKHLLQLINSILDIAKIESGRIKLALEEFSISKAIDEVDSIIMPLTQKNKIHFEKEVDADLFVVADKVKFKQVLYNLIGNAIKFTDRDGTIGLSVSMLDKKVKLPVSLRNRDSSILVRVEDSGIGIESEDIDRIFREFEQVDSSLSRNYEGVGLGLPLTKKFIEMHGGIIWVESEVGKGSSFNFVIPPLTLQNDVSEMIETAPYTLLPEESCLLTSEGLRQEPPSILVIEDDKGTQELLTLHLTKAGYRVLHALNGIEGIDKAKADKPFLILLDIMLPKKDGWEVLQELKSDPETKNIPVIINSIVNNKELGFTLGAADYLVKPLGKDALLKSIKEINILTKRSARPIKILIIDDNTESLQSLSEMLDGGGFSIHGTLSTKKGFDAAVEVRPDIILIDVALPSSGCLDMIKKLKEAPSTKETPILVLTEGEVSRDEKLKLLANIETIMQKELFSKDELLAEIRKMELLYPQRAGLIDGITGLFNIHYLSIRLYQEMSRAERYKEPISIIFMALDHFNAYAVKNGIILADSVLRTVAEILEDQARASDVVMKMAEGEFALILPCTMTDQSIIIANRVRKMIETYNFHAEELVSTDGLTASIGIATSYEDDVEPEDLILNAKKALKLAEAKGMNRVISDHQEWE